MSELWNLLLFHPLLNALIGLARITGDLGWSIILLTIGLRVVMTPLIIPSLKASKKMQDLAPDLAELKTKFKGDKQGLVTAQAELYKKHGLNPAAGCLPQIVQILVLIALFNAFNTVLKPNGQSLVEHLNPILYAVNKLPSDFNLSTLFYGMELTKPDLIHIPGLPIPLPGLFVLASALIQFASSKMMMPEAKTAIQGAGTTPGDSDDVMAATQTQMLYMFPLMTIFFGYQFQFGLVLYWLIFSAVSMVQQYMASGWGGLTPWINKLYARKN